MRNKRVWKISDDGGLVDHLPKENWLVQHVHDFMVNAYGTEEEKMIDAVRKGEGDKLLCLAQKHQDIQFSDADGNSLLHHALMGNQPYMISLLINMGINPNRVNHAGENILMLAIRYGLHEAAMEVMKNEGFMFVMVDLQGIGLLHYCAHYGQAIICEEMLRHGVNVNMLDFDGNNALHRCCELGSMNVATVLLIHGISTTQRNVNQEIPLQVAVRKKNREMARLIFTFMRGDNFYMFETMLDDLMSGKEESITLLNKTPRQRTHNVLEVVQSKERVE